MCDPYRGSEYIRINSRKKRNLEADFTATIWVIRQIMVHEEPEPVCEHLREHAELFKTHPALTCLFNGRLQLGNYVMD
jgi:hypothetical protein